MHWGAVTIEIGVLAVAFVVLAWELSFGQRGPNARRTGYAICATGLLGLLVLSSRLPVDVTFTEALVQDPFALYVKQLLLLAALLTVLASAPYADRRGWSSRSGEFLTLLLFATVGGMALVSAREFLTLFVAFELLSLPLYSLAAIEKNRAESPEGAVKFFLFGSVSSAMLLLGLGLLFAAGGTTFWLDVLRLDSPAARVGLVLLLVGFGFKIAMFPFYMWVPDTYQSAPTPFVAFLSVAPKAAGVAALFRLQFEVFAVHVPDVTRWVAVLAGGTMVVGNLLALPQTQLKRLLAYSGVAQIGYVLLALAAGTRLGAGMALFFFVAYLFSNMGAFFAVAAIESSGEQPTCYGVRNLIRRSPLLAAAFIVFLLSLGGIPFALGFWGKMYVFLAAGEAGLWKLVLLGALLAVVALYYYLNVVRFMLIVPDKGPSVRVPLPLALALLACSVLVVAGGLAPQWFVEPALRAVSGF
ncbi:MAG TPA: NADH-quinone oxidoreductase subunit N [Candidatus Polarisedimenticolaceae bacterium]|nr:NADH-quinone oxidoreductase subunit N [Candidatus Polarisedimenticolaceae bacterium]